MRKRIPPSSSSRRSVPESSSVSPPWVTSATESIWDQSTASALLAFASASESSFVGLVTSRTWIWPVRRPSRTTRLRSTPVAGAPVVRLEPLSPAPADDLLPRHVARLGGEQAVGDLDDVVPPARGVEAAHEVSVIGVGAERVLELVAVAPLGDGGHDLLERVPIQLADPAQSVIDLLLLDLELALVAEDLPGCAGMLGERRDPLRTRLKDLDRSRLGVGALGLRHDGEHAIARNPALDEHDVAVAAGDPGAAVGERIDRQLELIAARGTGRSRGDGVGADTVSVSIQEFGGTKRCLWWMPRRTQEPTRSSAARGDEDTSRRRQRRLD